MNIHEMLSDRSDRSSKTSHADDESQAPPTREPPVPPVVSAKNDAERSRSTHKRHQSLHVKWTEADVTRLAQEVYDETIAEVHLSLFGFWIREKEEHYSMAKLYVRELGLDQGYNTDRIPNPTLRRLLQDAHPMRPKSVAHRRAPSPSPSPSPPSPPPPNPPNVQNYYRSSSHSNLLLSSRALSLRYANGLLQAQLGAHTDGPLSREPLHATSTKLRMSAVTLRRAASSPAAATTESVPPSFQAERQRALNEGLRSSSLNVGAARRGCYPPDTPDRPAPLNLRSRPSQANCTTPTTPSALRPALSSTRELYVPSLSPVLPRNSVLFQDTAAHPLLALSAGSSSAVVDDNAGFDDIFGISSRPDSDFVDMSAVYPDTNSRSSRRYASREPYRQHSVGPYALNLADEASIDGSVVDGEEDGEYGTDRSGTASKIDRGVSDVDTCLDASEDEQSIVETASPTSDAEVGANSPVRVCYSYMPVGRDPTMSSSSLLHAAAQPHDRPSRQKPVGTASNFHHPLPLRSYESEAHLYPTSKAHGSSSHNRAHSATENSMHTASGAFEPAFAAESSTVPSARFHDKPNDEEDDDSDSDSASISLSDIEAELNTPWETGTDTGTDTGSSNISATLSAFPIPRMHNPAGELPMRILRATSGPPPSYPPPPLPAGVIPPSARGTQAPVSAPTHIRTRTRATDPPPPSTALTRAAHRAITSMAPSISPPHSLLASAWRTVAEADVANILLRTRALGAQLPVVDWEALSPFERTWREVHGEMLVEVYGRRDVELTDEDVQYVDAVQRLLRGVGRG